MKSTSHLGVGEGEREKDEDFCLTKSDGDERGGRGEWISFSSFLMRTFRASSNFCILLYALSASLLDNIWEEEGEDSK